MNSDGPLSTAGPKSRVTVPPAPKLTNSGASTSTAPAPEGAALDVVTQTQGEAARRVHARDVGAHVVTALFRLVKLSTLHSIDNQAMVRQVEETVQLVNEYGQRTDHNVSILFAHGSVFVGGQLLRANRSAYEGALELGTILERVGAAEIGIARDVRSQDLYALASSLADALRVAKPQRVERPSPRIRLRGLSAATLLREHEVEHLDASEQVVRAYASAVVIMRRFFEDVRRGRYVLPQRVKRLAQRLVDLSGGETPAFLGVTAARNANHDQAGRAVNTAILSLAMARQITFDVVMLSRIAMAALLYDVGHARLAGAGSEADARAMLPNLSEQQELETPAGAAVVLTALGRVTEPSVMRTVIAYEAHWAKHREWLGPLYRGLRQPALQARILAVAQAFNDVLTPPPGGTALTADQAIAHLEQGITEAHERTALRLLVGALGIFPTGTLVELSSGEVAIVVETPTNPAIYSQPRVRLVFDAAGGQIARPIEIDLALRRRPGEVARFIKRVVATSDDPSVAGLRSFVASSAADAPSRAVSAVLEAAAEQSLGVAHTAARDNRRRPSPPPPSMPALPSSAPEPSAKMRSTPPPRSSSAPPSLPSADAAAPAARALHDRAGFGQLSAPPRSPSSFSLPAMNARTQTLLSRTTPDDFSAATPPRPVNVQVVDTAPDGGDAAFPPDDDAMDLALPGDDEPAAELLELPASSPPGSAAAGDEASNPDDDVPFAVMRDDRKAVDAPSADVGSFERAPTGPPTADGDLAHTPMAHLLIYMLDKRLSGTTIFEVPNGVTHSVYFQDGVPSKVRTGAMVSPLDRVLVEMGLLDEQTLRGTLVEISKRRILHGRHLIVKGLVDRESLLSALRAQVLSKVTYLFELPAETRYAYYEGENLLASYGGPELTPCEPLAAIMAGIRLRANDPIIGVTLQRIAGRPLALHIDADLKRFHLSREEAAVVDLMRARRTALAEIIDAGVAQERVTRMVVYALAITRHLDFGVPGRPPVGFVARDRAAASERASYLGREAGTSDRKAAAPIAAAGRASRPPGSETFVPAAPIASPAPSSTSTPLPDTSAFAAAKASGDRPAPRPTTKMARVVQPAPGQAPAVVAARSPAVAAAPAAARAPAPPVAAAAPGRGSVPGAEPAKASRADVAARRAEIEKRVQTVDSDDYFQVLGVGREATPEQIRNAYFSLAKTWHPDRVSSEIVDLKPTVARVFARISEAYQTLSDGTKRKDYLALVATGGGLPEDQEKVAKAIDAALEFQKAEVLLKKNDLTGAEAFVTRAVYADPEQPEYITMLIWIQALRRGDPPAVLEGHTTPHFDDLIKKLDTVLQKEPRYERALYYRAVLQKRAGRPEKAIRDFKLVAELNPKNLEAIRELRLAEMRHRGAGGHSDAPEAGIFGKLFKR